MKQIVKSKYYSDECDKETAEKIIELGYEFYDKKGLIDYNIEYDDLDEAVLLTVLEDIDEDTADIEEFTKYIEKKLKIKIDFDFEME